jgi:uncharacterized OsmC-like protein
MSSIADAIRKASAYLKAHPEEASYTDSAAVARLDGGLRVTVTAADGRTVSSDMVKAVGGSDSAASPGWLFRAALAACETTLIAMRAAAVGIDLTELEVTVDSESNDFGILGIDDAVPAGPLSIRSRIRVRASSARSAQLREIVGWAVAHCPVADLATRAVPMTLDIDAG